MSTSDWGFGSAPRVQYYLQKIAAEMVQKEEISIHPKYCFSPTATLLGDFRFVVMQRFLSYQNEISMSNTLIVNLYFLLKNFSLSEEKEYAIDDST